MKWPGLDLEFLPQSAPLPVFAATVTATQWSALAVHVAASSGQLVTLWADSGRGPDSSISAAYQVSEGLLVVDLPLDDGTVYPDLGALFFPARRLQRAVRDLSGVSAAGAGDRRPWLRHAAWPADWFPLVANPGLTIPAAPGHDDYAFVEVEGEGVHEIPVGPVHAGIIEPGHFRFSVVGEKVLRLEQRLGYTHKGIAQRFVGLDLESAARLAARVSGDSTVAYGWACAMAAEGLTGAVPDRAQWLRAVLLERERVANHLGDLGALGNDAAFGFAQTQFSMLREDWQRLNHAVFGHRLLMDVVVPGGVAVDIDDFWINELRRQHEEVRMGVSRLRRIFDEHAGLQDRLVTTGRINLAVARRLGLTGMAARASGIARDLRADYPWPPYATLGCRCITQHGGDVAARVAQRFDELFEALRLLDRLLLTMPPGPALIEAAAARGRRGFGWIEGWRGPVLVVLETADDGRIVRGHCHDPSWQNWPALEYAVLGNIVADFPLINKSFNLSYAGHDV
ncbi:MAG: Ni,Fe-hydrogenase III large subunit [Gammaproteobacteria bacterium]